jgi:copper chaperone
MQFNVSGMTCGHCAQAITTAIEQTDPRAAVKVDVAGGTVP